jgi:hypothetical protein
MNRHFISVGALFVFALSPLFAGPAGTQSQVFEISQPTIIAFYPPIHQAEANDDEVLADFQFYASRALAPLKKAGIQFHEVYAISFQVRERGKTRSFTAGKAGVGYYMIAPGRAPHVEPGVMTDEDLYVVARKYFHRSIGTPAS